MKMHQSYKNSFEWASSKYEITGLLVRDFTCLEKISIMLNVKCYFKIYM